MVITSRYPDWQEVATPLQVDVFDRTESVSLQELLGRLRQLGEFDEKRLQTNFGAVPAVVGRAECGLRIGA